VVRQPFHDSVRAPELRGKPVHQFTGVVVNSQSGFIQVRRRGGEQATRNENLIESPPVALDHGIRVALKVRPGRFRLDIRRRMRSGFAEETPAAVVQTDAPQPVGPMTAAYPPAGTERDTGPRRNAPWRMTMASRWITTVVCDRRWQSATTGFSPTRPRLSRGWRGG